MLQHICVFFANHHARRARIDTDHTRKDGGVGYPEAVYTFDAQLRIDRPR